MRIVVGMDFSPSARQAADFAATLAMRAASDVVLVHALERPRDAAPRDGDAVRARLAGEAAKLRASGAAVEVELAAGPPAQALLGAVARHRADLLVVGIVGQRAAGRLVLGSTTEQVAQASPVPVLGLRFEEAFHPWLHGNEALRVLHADDGSPGAAAALAWSSRLSAVGPLALTVARIVPCRSRPAWWPFARRGRDAAETRGAEQELVERVERLSRAGEVHVVVRRCTGPVAHELLAIAAERRVGLILAGSQQRGGLRRIWSTSVARSLLAGSLVSVLMVPADAVARDARPIAAPDAARPG